MHTQLTVAGGELFSFFFDSPVKVLFRHIAATAPVQAKWHVNMIIIIYVYISSLKCALMLFDQTNEDNY